ncbi:uncharacterized protein METZ01_LOCUS338230, partial [marine metagenome]
VPVTKEEFVSDVKAFNTFGTKTHVEEFNWTAGNRSGVTMKAFNEFWTSAQRQSHSLHEISYR